MKITSNHTLRTESFGSKKKEPRKNLDTRVAAAIFAGGATGALLMQQVKNGNASRLFKYAKQGARELTQDIKFKMPKFQMNKKFKDEYLGETFKAAKEFFDKTKLALAGATAGALGAGSMVTAKISSEENNKKFTWDGEVFEGKFKNGLLYNSGGKKYTGKLIIDYNDGKQTVVEYENGLLLKSKGF